MKNSQVLKGAMVAAAALLPMTQASAEVSISGWINEGLTFYDDGQGSDVVQLTDNGNTLGSRMTFAASTELSNGLTAGMEVILEPRSGVLGFGSGATAATYENDNGDALGVLGNSLYVSGNFGKVTVGLQSMPTDNIAVLEDPSLTLWSGISPVFRGNGVTVQGLTGAAAGTATYGSFLNCYTNTALRGSLGIGIDCNGTYLRGVRYDLPAFGPVTVAVGAANDDIYDIAAKYKGQLGRLNAQVGIGYALNNQGAAGLHDGAENFQMQAGLMDPVTGVFGSIAYQLEDADLVTAASALEDETDAWWLKLGIKKQWLSVGDTSVSFDYGIYSDQYGLTEAANGVTGSEVDRIGFSVDQYFGSALIIYGKYENLDIDVDGSALYNGADELDTFTMGAVYFF